MGRDGGGYDCYWEARSRVDWGMQSRVGLWAPYKSYKTPKSTSQCLRGNSQYRIVGGAERVIGDL